MPDHRLPYRLPDGPSRIAVAGVSGAGKTTLCRLLSERLDLPYTELDSLYHGPGWTVRPEFEADARRVLAGPEWVTEWQYGLLRPTITARATLLIWLDLPVPVVMWQVTRRTVGRRLTRQVLWNGNREPGFHTIVTDHDHIIRWAWRTRHKLAPRLSRLSRDRPELSVLTLHSRREVHRFLAGLEPRRR